MGIFNDIKKYLVKTNNEELNVFFNEITDEFKKLTFAYNEICKLAENNYKHSLLDEVENKIVSLIDMNEAILTFQDSDGRNLGMTACYYGLEKVIKRTLSDEKASIQQDNKGMNIGMHLAFNSFIYKNYPFADYRGMVKTALENETISTQQDNDGKNVGMYLASTSYEDLLMIALENKNASLQQNKEGYNMGMFAAMYNHHNATMKALDNEEASVHQSKTRDGYNIGMICAIYQDEECVLKALDNKTARTQQSFRGNNIGMYSAESKLENATLKALEDSTARAQANKKGETIYSIIKNKNLTNLFDDVEKYQAEDEEIQTCETTEDDIMEN